MRRFLCFCLLAGFALTGFAATPGVPPAVNAALARMAPGVKIGKITRAPLPGYYQTVIGGRMVYVSADGKWILDGKLYNADQRVDLSARAMRAVRREALAKLPASDFITYAPPHAKYSVTVFTDLECEYCRILHQHLKQINAEGIAVRYLFWPRTGLKMVPSGRPTSSYLKSVAVWCAHNRKAAFEKVRTGGSLPAGHCANPIAANYHLGQRLGVDGTPTIIAPDGTVLGGYLSPAQLLRALQVQQPAHSP